MTPSLRESFEAWLLEKYPSLKDALHGHASDVHGGWNYDNEFIEDCWQTWQVAHQSGARAMQEQAAKKIKAIENTGNASREAMREAVLKILGSLKP